MARIHSVQGTGLFHYFRGAYRWALLLAIVNFLLCMVFVTFIFPAINREMYYGNSFDEYDDIALNIAAGKGFLGAHDEPTVSRGPVYPAIAGLLYYIGGNSNIYYIEILHSLLSALTVFATYILARRLVNERVALLATAFIAVHPQMIWYTSRVALENLFTLLCVLVYIFVERTAEKPTRGNIIILGVAIGVASLTKGFAIVFPVLAAVYLLIRRAGIRRTAIVAAALVLIMLVVISPWTVRNYLVAGEFILVQANTCHALITGHFYPLLFKTDPLSIHNGQLRGWAAFPEIAAAHGYEAHPFPPQSLEAELVHEKSVKQYIRQYYMDNPSHLITHSAIRALQFWYLRHSVGGSVAMAVMNGGAILLSIAGFFALRGNAGRWLPVLAIVLFNGLHALIIGEARFTLPLQPMLMILAAAGVLLLWDTARKRFLRPRRHDRESLIGQTS